MYQCTSSRSQAVRLGTQHSTLGKGAGMCEGTQIACHHMPGTGSAKCFTRTHVQCECLCEITPTKQGGLTNVQTHMCLCILS